MAGVFSLTLAISIVGLVTLLLLKRYEMTTSRVMLGTVRPRVGRFFHRILMFVERGVPGALYRGIWRATRLVRVTLQRGLAHAMLVFERGLEQVLAIVRYTSHGPQGQASGFLREVAAHKQKILKRSSRSRAIFED